MGKVNVIMDASQFDMFLLCECRFDRRYNQNRTAFTKATQLDRGTLVHVGNEVYYEALKQGAKYQDAVNASLSKIREAGVIATDLEPEVVTRVMDVMEEYYDYWRHEDQNLIIKEVEKPFLYLLYEDDEVRFYMAGKIDLIYDDNSHTNMPMDHKSYDRDSEVHRMSNQFKNYCYALHSEFLIVNRIGFQKTLKPHEKFKRPQLTYDKPLLEEWRENVIRKMFQYLDCVATGIWPMNDTSCDKYNRRCEYFNVCDTSGKEAKLYKLHTEFNTVEPWDVSKVLRKASEVLNEARDKSKEQVQHKNDSVQ